MSQLSEVVPLSHSPNGLRLVVRLLGEGVSLPIVGHRPSWAAVLLCAVDDALDPTPAWLQRVWDLADQIEAVELLRLERYPETTDRRLLPEEREQPEMEVVLRFRGPAAFAERLAALSGWDLPPGHVTDCAAKSLAHGWGSYVGAFLRAPLYWRKEVGWTKARIHKVVPPKWKGSTEDARQLLRSAAIASSRYVWDVLPQWSEAFDTTAFRMDFIHLTSVVHGTPVDDPRVEAMLTLMLGERELRNVSAVRLGVRGPKLHDRTKQVLRRVHAGDSLERMGVKSTSQAEVGWALWRATGDLQYVAAIESKPRTRKNLRRSLQAHGRGLEMSADMWPWEDW